MVDLDHFIACELAGVVDRAQNKEATIDWLLQPTSAVVVITLLVTVIGIVHRGSAAEVERGKGQTFAKPK